MIWRWYFLTYVALPVGPTGKATSAPLRMRYNPSVMTTPGPNSPPSPRPPDYRDRAGRPIVPGDLIARGGEGTVYRCPGRPGQVVKIWKQPRDGKGRRKAELMAGLTPPVRDAGYFIAWPTAVAYDGAGRAAGVLMPELPGGGGAWKDAIEVLHPQRRERTAREQGRTGAIEQIDLATAALNYAHAVQALHELGAIVGDINDKNVQVDARNRVAVLDCDSFQVTDPASGEVYPAPAHRAEFQAPELQGGVRVADIRRGIEHDSFALGVLVFKMLCGGEHPFGGRPNDAEVGDFTLAQRIREGWNPLDRRNRVNLDPAWKARWDELGTELQITLYECLYGPAESRPGAREIADGGLAPYIRELKAKAPPAPPAPVVVAALPAPAPAPAPVIAAPPLNPYATPAQRPAPAADYNVVVRLTHRGDQVALESAIQIQPLSPVQFITKHCLAQPGSDGGGRQSGSGSCGKGAGQRERRRIPKKRPETTAFPGSRPRRCAASR